VLAEQYHPYTGAPISVSPLTWSHATFVIAVTEWLKKHESLKRATGRGMARGQVLSDHAAGPTI
jgi:hypothetical protein